MAVRSRILVYAPWSLNGRGPGQTCVWLLAGFPSQGVQTELFAPRTRIAIAGHVKVHQSLPILFRRMPWRYAPAHAQRCLDEDFARALETANPTETVAYFWPDPPVELVQIARDRGIPTVREMINTACATSGPILDEAFTRLGLPPNHSINPDKILTETRELRAHDYFFASNPEVERSLLELGFAPDQILTTSFGWSPDRFPNLGRPSRLRSGLRFLFVGTLNVRKGLPELLEAWQDSQVPGELVLAGQTEPEGRGTRRKSLNNREGTHSRVHRKCRRAFLWCRRLRVPESREEGGPQVTYEAAGFGLPVITTAMGAGRLVVDGKTGVVVDAGSVPQLTRRNQTFGLTGGS